MKSAFRFSAAALLLLTISVSLGLALPEFQEPDPVVAAKPVQDDEVAVEGQFAPVEDMHHFMEYVCQPGYKGLKQILATKPEGRAAWNAFKNHALVLAETSALVAARAPEDEAKAKQWRNISLDVYKSGTSLYKSAGNYDDAKAHFGRMVDQCNQCHTVFAKGKHQLAK